MNSSENGGTVDDKNVSNETKRVSLVTDSARERSIEDFLKKPDDKKKESCSADLKKVIPVLDGNFNNKTVTSPPLNDEIMNKIPDNKSSILSDNESIVSLNAKSISSYHTGKSIPDIERDNTPVTSDGDNDNFNQAVMDKDRQVATPTIKTRQREPSTNHKKAKDFQRFTDKLNELSATLQRKDDEIKRLSQMLLDLECKESKSKSKPKRKSSSGSSSSSSSSTSSSGKSDETETQKSDNSKVKVVEKEKKKDKEKKEDKIGEKGKDKEKKEDKVGEKGKDKEKKEDKVGEKGKDKKKDKAKKEENITEKIPENNEKKISTNDEVQPSVTNETHELTALNLKLCGLEEEVRRLQQTNVEAILAATNRHNYEDSDEKITNEIVTKKLLLEHNLLKEKIEQLRSEQKKLTQYVPLEDDIKKLKDDVHELRNQNELLQRYVKSSSANALNHPLKPQSKKDPFKEKPKVLHHGTKYSGDHVKPGSGDKRSFRARKLSDSSSVLIEDVTPKVWLEPIYGHSSRPNRGKDRYEVDQCSSGTEDWGRQYTTSGRNKLHHNCDLLSTSDSDTIEDLTERHQNQRKPIYSCPFTPKSPNDLSLDDLVKFERPGGKMSLGRVCFVGYLAGRRELCVGLELDEESGNHDGVFEDRRYFQCKRNRGVFISFHKIVFAYKSL